MTSRLASFSKIIIQIVGFTVLVVACKSTAGTQAVSEDSSSNEETSVMQQAAIELPPGAKQMRKAQGDANSLFDQIPEAAMSNEVSLPIEAVPDARSEAEERRHAKSTQRTDSEILGASKSIDDRYATDLGGIDQQLGVEPKNASDTPSYVEGVQHIKSLYKEKKFEESLVETNDLLRFYPNSVQLLMMKGTLHQRIGNIDLALASYKRAYEMEPSKKLQAQIVYLKRLVTERERLRRPMEGVVIPGGVQEMKTEGE